MYSKKILPAAGAFLKYIVWGEFPFFVMTAEEDKTEVNIVVCILYGFADGLIKVLCLCSLIFMLIALVLAH